MKRLYGFTLAEVLVTMAVIGVVAALTIPVIVEKIETQITKTSVRKVYNEISNANNMLNFQNGGNWKILCNDFDNKCFRDTFAQGLSTVKICDRPLADGCVASSTFRDKSIRAETIAVNDNWPGLVTKGGYSIKFRLHTNNCAGYIHCGWIQVDINGIKAPNIVGRDIFFFVFMPDGTVKPSRFNIDISEIKSNCNSGSGMACGYLYLYGDIK